MDTYIDSAVHVATQASLRILTKLRPWMEPSFCSWLKLRFEMTPASGIMME